MKLKNILILLILSSFSLSAGAQLQPDSTFGQDGYFITTFPATTHTYKIHELPSGELLCFGAQDGNLRIWKYDALGNAITTFGTNGAASIPPLDNEVGTMHTLHDFEIYDNGKIMVLAKQADFVFMNNNQDEYSIILASFNADGSINTSFNNSGYLLDNPDSNFEYNPWSLQIDVTDEIHFYVGSEAYPVGQATCPFGVGAWCISKYKDDGTKDLTFNGTGFVQGTTGNISLTGTPASPHGRIRDMALQPNGSIRAVGAFHNVDRAFFDMALKPNGQWDSTFATNGRAVYTVNFDVRNTAYGMDCKILDDQSAVFYASEPTSAFDSTKISLVKNDALGNPMTSYGANGTGTLIFPDLGNTRFIYKSDGSMLLTNYKKYGTDQKIEFMRLTPNGTHDLTFGNNGILQTQPITPDVYINQSATHHGIWNSSETKIFVATSKQPVAQINYGIFKYEWPGLAALSLNDATNASQVEVYPNPIYAGQQLHIKNITSGKVNLISLNGSSTTLSMDKNGITSLPNTLSSGIYILQAHTADKVYSKKIIIK